jgi:hypothetical protein
VRKSIRSFIQMVSETLTVPEPIYEFGSLQVEGQEGFADLRPLFPASATSDAICGRAPAWIW